MIVVGVDVHKHSLTAVAVDEAGRLLEEMTLASRRASAACWAAGLGRGAAVGARGLPPCHPRAGAVLSLPARSWCGCRRS